MLCSHMTLRAPHRSCMIRPSTMPDGLERLNTQQKVVRSKNVETEGLGQFEIFLIARVSYYQFRQVPLGPL